MNEQQAIGGSDLEMASSLISYLKNKGVLFGNDGFPILPRTWFLETVPDEILPFSRRNLCRDKSKTALCFFCDDSELYPRIRSVLKDLSIYQNYLGALSMDISVSRYMLLEVQRFNFLLNSLFLAVLGVNGIPIVPAVRFGSLALLPIFRIYTNAKIWCAGCIGTRGNSKSDRAWEDCCREAFLLCARPRIILSYGFMRGDEQDSWNRNGIQVISYEDFQTRSREGEFVK